jgi:hypothetical protein
VPSGLSDVNGNKISCKIASDSLRSSNFHGKFFMKQLTRITHEFRYVALICSIAAILFILFLLVFALHEHFWQSDILLYTYFEISIFYIFTCIVCILLLRAKFASFKRRLTFSVIFLSLLISILTQYAFTLTFPITIDRSFSVYLLGSLSKHDEPISLVELESFVSRYFHEREMVSKRIHEQLITGSITIQDGSVRLTQRGKNIVCLHILLGRVFNLNMKNIVPK